MTKGVLVATVLLGLACGVKAPPRPPLKEAPDAGAAPAPAPTPPATPAPAPAP